MAKVIIGNYKKLYNPIENVVADNVFEIAKLVNCSNAWLCLTNWNATYKALLST